MNLGCSRCGSLQSEFHFQGCTWEQDHPSVPMRGIYGSHRVHGFGLAKLKTEGELTNYDD